jgi:hypothetical protein
MYNVLFKQHSLVLRLNLPRPQMASKKHRLRIRIQLFTLKVHKHDNNFLTFFAETKTLWYQGPVTQDF